MSKASKDKSKAIDGGAHASKTKGNGISSDTKRLKSQSLAEKKEQKEPQRVPKKKGDDKNEGVSKEKQPTSDVKEKEKKSNKGSLPPTGGPTGGELV